MEHDGVFRKKYVMTTHGVIESADSVSAEAHHCHAPLTHRTNACLQSHTAKAHCRGYLYNKTCNTEHKYINFGLFEGATEK